MSVATSAQAWHTQQKDTVTSYKPKQPNIPGDYVGGGMNTGATAVPPHPPGLENFANMQSSYELVLGGAALTFLIITLVFGSKQ